MEKTTGGWRDLIPLDGGTSFTKLATPMPTENSSPLELSGSDEQPEKLSRKLCEVVRSPAQLTKLRAAILSQKILGLDYETTDVRPRHAHLVGVGVSFSNGDRYYVPVGHRELEVTEARVPKTIQGRTHSKKGEPYSRLIKTPKPPLECPLVEGQLDPRWAMDFIRWLFAQNIQIVAHNLKYELTCTRSWLPGLTITADLKCSLIADWLALSKFGVRHGLKAVALREFGVQMTTFDDVTKGKGNKQIAFSDIGVTAQYCGDDAYYALALYERLLPSLERDGLLKVYNNLEMPICLLLVDMEMTGVRVDCDHLRGMKVRINEKIAELEKKLEEFVGEPLVLRSHKQMSRVCYNKMGFSVPPGTKRGVLGELPVDAKVNKWWRENGDSTEKAFAELHHEWSEVNTLLSRYTDSIIEAVDRDGRLRAQNNQTGTETGRFSMSEPNLQNIPSRTELGKEVRQAFIPDIGKLLVVADYSQLEPRITAHFSQDKELVQCYKDGRDIYNFLVEMLKARGVEGVTRFWAKTLVLGLMYGLTGKALGVSLNISQDEAESLYATFFEAFPEVSQWKFDVIDTGARLGYAATICGRRRYVPDIQLPAIDKHWKQMSEEERISTRRRERAERQIVNTTIQGSAADIVKLAMRNIDRSFKEKGIPAQILFQVHDEIICEVPSDRAQETADEMQKQMQDVIELGVPLVVKPIIVDRWSEAKD